VEEVASWLVATGRGSPPPLPMSELEVLHKTNLKGKSGARIKLQINHERSKMAAAIKSLRRPPRLSVSWPVGGGGVGGCGGQREAASAKRRFYAHRARHQTQPERRRAPARVGAGCSCFSASSASGRRPRPCGLGCAAARPRGRLGQGYRQRRGPLRAHAGRHPWTMLRWWWNGFRVGAVMAATQQGIGAEAVQQQRQQQRRLWWALAWGQASA
jgi:hypothetical protein